MRLRIFTEPQQGASYSDLLTVAKAAEDLGFDAFFRSDHYLKMGAVSGLPGPTDAWLTLAGLARDTSRIRLGTLVSPVTFRAPGPFAISIAQVDEMSGGRVELGLGAGWFEDEHTAYGIPFPAIRDRYDILEEQLAIIDGLWRTPAAERFSFSGKHFELVDAPPIPKPLQQPRPPIVLGGRGKRRSAALAAQYADEYNVGFSDVRQTAAIFDEIRDTLATAGRAANSMRYSAALTIAVGSNDAELDRRATAIGRDVAQLRSDGLAGSPAEVVDRLGQYAEIGAETIYLQILDLQDLDHLELIAATVLPEVG